MLCQCVTGFDNSQIRLNKNIYYLDLLVVKLP